MRKYNFVYRRLVPEGSNDLVGLLAYSIYKNQKIKFIESYVAEHGHDPSEDEIDRFHRFTSSDLQLEQYLKSAEKDLELFLNYVLQAKADDIEQFYRDAFRGVAKESGHGFWYGIWQGVLSSAIYTLLLGMIVLFSWSTQLSPKDVFERVFKVKIVSDTTRSVSPSRPQTERKPDL